MSLSFDRAARVWHRLWSVRLALAAALMPALEAVLPLWHPVLGELPYAGMATVLALLSAAARVVHQPRAQDALDTSRSRSCRAGL